MGYLGALLTLLSLAFGRVSQQSIAFRIDQVPISSHSQVGDVARLSYVDTICQGPVLSI